MISKAHSLFFGSKKKTDYERLAGSSGKHTDKYVMTLIEQVRDPQQICHAAFGEAMRVSRSSVQFSNDDSSLQKWQAARASCQPAGLSFHDAVNMPVWGHQTPLECLVTAYDHHALHFVHSCLPQKIYRGNIYLGKLSEARPARIIHDIPNLKIYGEMTPHKSMLLQEKEFPFTYRGDKAIESDGRICGYGVVTWLKGKIYVGQWESRFETILEKSAVLWWTWLGSTRQEEAAMQFLHHESFTSSPALAVYQFSDSTDVFKRDRLSTQRQV